MKIKKLISAVISAAMCFSLFTVNVSALEDSTTTSTETPIEMVAETSDSEQLLANSFSNSIRLEDIDVSESQLNGITVEETDGISLYSNSAPVAGLTVVVANQESILNGKATTDTILLWLWYDGTTAYTYDPDGERNSKSLCKCH